MSRRSRPTPTSLPEELLDRHETRRVSIPRPLISVMVVLVVIVVAFDLFTHQWGGAIVTAVLGIAGAFSATRPNQQLAAATSLQLHGAAITMPGRADQSMEWSVVNGVRVFTRPAPPQLLLRDGSAVGVPGLTSAQGEDLARHLPSVTGTSVTFEVDGRPASL